MADEVERLRARAAREHSARRQAEAIAEKAIADLTAANLALDRRVAERTKDLAETLARLAEADSVKSTFLRGAAHEMSTPLHAIRGLVELIETESSDPESRSTAKQARRAADTLHQALRTLVEFAAASAGDVAARAEPVVLGDYADLLAERWRLVAARHGVLLVVETAPDPSVCVDVDPTRLDQIVDALLDNAVRYASATINVELTALESSRRLRVAVSDDGEGIPEVIQGRIFDSFVRGSGSGDGFGIGLTLAKLVAQALGGELTIDDAPASGTRFVVDLPVT